MIIEAFETRNFPQQRQEVLDFLFQQRLHFRPDLVFVHTRSDIHQNHNIVTEEALRAFRGTTVLGFDVIRSSYGFFPHFLVEVSEEDVQAKLTALTSYKTYADRYYFDPSLLHVTMVRHGALQRDHTPKDLISSGLWRSIKQVTQDRWNTKHFLEYA